MVRGLKTICFASCLTLAAVAHAQGDPAAAVQPAADQAQAQATDATAAAVPAAPAPAAAVRTVNGVETDAPFTGWFNSHAGLRLNLHAAYPVLETGKFYTWGFAGHGVFYLDLAPVFDLGIDVGYDYLFLPTTTNLTRPGGVFNVDLALRLKRPQSYGNLVSPYFGVGVGVGLTGALGAADFGPRLDGFAEFGVLFRGHNWPVWIGPSVRFHEIFAVGAVAPQGNFTVQNASILTFGLTIDINAGGSDMDHDGVQAAQDWCRGNAGPASNRGCPFPDMDADGVSDSQDKCPTVPGAVSAHGCPDRDGDGVQDSEDKCPDLKGDVSAQGCPDRDGDGVADADDKCPDLKGDASGAGCPDRDHDGVADADDKCPDVSGSPTAAGCPDQDGDGVPDADDKCPTFPGLPQFQGCLDTDGDGVSDDKDLCPRVKGPESNNGCPAYKTVVIKADRLELSQKILFSVNGSRILPKSNALMTEIGTALRDRGDVCIRIEGHTDSTGKLANNMKLSQARADSVKTYLVGKGVAATRLSTKGYGPEQPVDSNATATGRERNRRVEFVTVDCKSGQ